MMMQQRNLRDILGLVPGGMSLLAVLFVALLLSATLFSPSLLAQAPAPVGPPSVPGPSPAPSLRPAAPAPGAPSASSPAAPQNASPAVTPSSSATAHKPHKVQKEKEKELVLPPLPSGPLSQMPMDQIPATPAKVSFQNGALVIFAQNSTLSEILREVRKLTGAAIDIPQGSAANERVVGSFGPGAPRDVLASLLNGTSFNYVMVGSNADPTAVSSVILSAKSGSASTGPEVPTQTANAYQNDSPPNNMPPGPMMPGRPRPFMMQQNLPQPNQAENVPQPNQPPAAADNNEDKDADETADDSAADDQTAADATDANAQGQQQSPDANAPNAGPKTPEQIMDMLRRQQTPTVVNQGGQPPQQ